MKIQLIRHATLILNINNKKILVDPVLGKAETRNPIANVPNQNNNPLVELPININFIYDCDAILVTHTHSDHFDEEAARLLPKNIPLFCQRADKKKIKAKGFNDVRPVKSATTWEGITFNRTGGRHGHGLTALKMSPVSGFVVEAEKEPSTYIMGDTVWCSKVKKALDKYKPEIAVINCGSAQFSKGKPITMGTEDIQEIYNNSPQIKVVAVHMEAWNHCRLTRVQLKEFLKGDNIYGDVHVPDDGELLEL